MDVRIIFTVYGCVLYYMQSPTDNSLGRDETFDSGWNHLDYSSSRFSLNSNQFSLICTITFHQTTALKSLDYIFVNLYLVRNSSDLYDESAPMPSLHPVGTCRPEVKGVALVWRYLRARSGWPVMVYAYWMTANMCKNGGTDDRPIEWLTWCAKMAEPIEMLVWRYPRHDWFTDIADTEPIHTCCGCLLNGRRHVQKWRNWC